MNKKAKRFTISITITLIVMVCFCTKATMDIFCGMEKAIISRTSQTSNNFVPMWNLDDIYIRESESAVYLVASNNKLVLYGRKGLCGGGDTLVGISENDGEIITTGLDGNPIPSNSGIRHIAYTPNFIYLGLDGARSTPSKVAAYEIDTNSIAWVQPLPINGGSQIGSLVTDKTTVGVSTTQYFLLDALTGEIKRELDKEPSSSLPSSYGFYALWYAAAHPQAELSTLEFWNNQTPEIHQPPIVLDDIIVLRTGDGRLLGRVRAFDTQTNALFWETAPIVVSNVAVDKSRAYFLTTSAELIVMDIRTGLITGKIEFAPKNIITESDYGFYVAAEENNVFIYFGDSQQLFAFHETLGP
jgi:outer membrane protein assembly factor BamB